MPYCTLADVEDAAGGRRRLLELTDWDNLGEPNVARINAAIATADALIDSFASKRFTIPMTPVTAIVTLHSATLARVLLARRRGMSTPNEETDWEKIAGTDERQPGWLLLLARGEVTPGSDPLPRAHGTLQNDSVETTMPADRDAAREKLAGFW